VPGHSWPFPGAGTPIRGDAECCHPPYRDGYAPCRASGRGVLHHVVHARAKQTHRNIFFFALEEANGLAFRFGAQADLDVDSLGWVWRAQLGQTKWATCCGVTPFARR
jgi:hypothetical protein